jgi:hypothetical protein
LNPYQAVVMELKSRNSAGGETESWTQVRR